MLSAWGQFGATSFALLLAMVKAAHMPAAKRAADPTPRCRSPRRCKTSRSSIGQLWPTAPRRAAKPGQRGAAGWDGACRALPRRSGARPLPWRYGWPRVPSPSQDLSFSASIHPPHLPDQVPSNQCEWCVVVVGGWVCNMKGKEGTRGTAGELGGRRSQQQRSNQKQPPWATPPLFPLPPAPCPLPPAPLSHPLSLGCDAVHGDLFAVLLEWCVPI